MNPHNELIAFVLDSAESVALPKRARLYRALAEIVGVPQEAAHLRGLAKELESADRLCRQFKFSFSQKQTDQRP